MAGGWGKGRHPGRWHLSGHLTEPASEPKCGSWGPHGRTKVLDRSEEQGEEQSRGLNCGK